MVWQAGMSAPLFPPWPSLRLSRVRIFGPRVLGISCPQVLANQGIGVCPKAGQIVGDLGDAHVRREQVHQHRHSAASDARRLQQPKYLLNPDSDDRWSAGFVLD